MILAVMSLMQTAIPLAMKEMLARIELAGSVRVFAVCVVVYAVMWLWQDSFRRRKRLF